MQAEIDSLKLNMNQAINRIRVCEDRFDTLNTPIWKRVLFRLDGWPPWYIVVKKPRWRPWRKWFIS